MFTQNQQFGHKMQIRIPCLVCVITLLGLISTACQPVLLPQEEQAAMVPEMDVSLDEQTVATIEQTIEQAMAEWEVPGLAIGVIMDGNAVYTQGFGVMELGTDKLVTPRSNFYWASVAKSATATAIMQLVEQGKVDLDAPVVDYLPYFEMADEQYNLITISQVLSHMAGIPDMSFSTRREAYKSADSDDDALERFVRNLPSEPLLSAPGTEWSYSTLGFTLLGDVIAKVTGKSYEEYVQENIFTPLSMEQTTFLLKESLADSLVSPHTVSEQGEVVVGDIYPYYRPYSPGSGILSNVEEMTRYALAHLNQGELDGVRILEEAAYADMWQSVSETTIPDPIANEYGLGWMIGEHAGYRTVGHDGLVPEFNSFVTLIPEKEIAVVLTVNYTQYDDFVFPAFRIRGPIFDALLEASSDG